MDALHLMGEHKVGLKIRAKYCSSSTESADTAGKLMCPFVFRVENQLYHGY